MKKISVWLSIFVMGIGGLGAQVVLIREFLIVLAGNEFSIGVILANWLILEAGGCFAGRSIEKLEGKKESFAVVTLLFSISLVVSVFIVRILKGLLGISVGETVSFTYMFLSTLGVLAPVSITHGALFTIGCLIYSSARNSSNVVGKVYLIEMIGTFVGGFLFTYILLPRLNTFSISSGIGLIGCLTSLLLLYPERTRRTVSEKATFYLTTVFTLLFTLLTLYSGSVHQFSIGLQWKGLNVVHYQNSRHGNICVIENEGQYLFFQDGVPTVITPVPDAAFIEQFVHIPMLAHPKPERVLIIGGGAGGMIKEVLRHPTVKSVEYAEIDPLLIKLLRKFSTPLTEAELNDKRVKIKYIDGRLMVRNSKRKFDLILTGISDPSNLQLNRLFTKEFFLLARSKLKQEGIFVTGIKGSLIHTNMELKNLNSCIYRTLNLVFPHVRFLIAEGTNIILASNSDAIISVDGRLIRTRLKDRGIDISRGIPRYIEQSLHPGWRQWFDNFIEGGSKKINYDFKPIGVFYSINYWNSLFAPYLARVFRYFEHINLLKISSASFVLILLFLTFGLIKRNSSHIAVPLSIMTTGFGGMVFDLVYIFGFQSIYGYVFNWIGILVSAFMAGGAAGAWIATKYRQIEIYCFRFFVATEVSIMVFALLCPILIGQLGGATLDGSSLIMKPVFFALSVVGGFLTGFQFPVASWLYPLYYGDKRKVTAGRMGGTLYSSDLLGGWIGGMVGGGVLLPVLGIYGTCITVFTIKLVSFTFLMTMRRA